jgi:hypothetical protein
MWHFSPGLARAKLGELADILIQQGRLASHDKDQAIDQCAARLKSHFGITLSRAS